MKTHGNRRWISGAYCEIDIADAAVESEFICIHHFLAGSRTLRCKLQHISPSPKKFVALLKAGRIWPKYEYRPMLSIADQSNSRPEVDCVSDSIFTLGDEDNALAGCIDHTIDCSLNGSRIVGPPIRNSAEASAVQVYGVRIVR